MLPEHISQDEKYKFVIDNRQGFYIVFVPGYLFGHHTPFEPLWHRQAGDERSFRALVRWVGVRRARWQEWGRLAEALGRNAFYQHMHDLMIAEPVAECVGWTVQGLDDPHEVGMGEMIQGPNGLQTEELYRHRFKSAAARDRFFQWFYSDENFNCAPALLQIGYSRGTAELGKTLDELAEEVPKAQPRAKGKRKLKATA